jgi:hypothetical protein
MVFCELPKASGEERDEVIGKNMCLVMDQPLKMKDVGRVSRLYGMGVSCEQKIRATAQECNMAQLKMYLGQIKQKV